VVFATSQFVMAGTVDSTDRYAWTENSGWLDFGTSQGDVAVSDTELTGYAWGENIGWASLNCSNTSSCATVDYKVANDGEGNLSGYAWGENIGWINFAPTGGGVTINSSGEFSGYAWGENIGWLVFNCATTDSCGTVDYGVKTDWAAATQTATAAATQTGSIAGQYNAAYVEAQTMPKTPPEEKENKITFNWPWNWFGDQTQNSAPSQAVPESAPQDIEPDALPDEEIIEIEVPQLPEISDGQAQTAAEQNKTEFSFLPESLLNFAQKFPQLFETLKKTGVKTIADITKLKNVVFNLPDLAKILGGGDIARNAQKIPEEVIFARAFGIDLSVKIAADQDGKAEQKIKIVKNTALELIVKPEHPARSVKGAIVLKIQNQKTGGLFEKIFASRVLAQNENANVLAEFGYQDDDGDGVFIARIDAPQVRGEYDLTAKIDYEDFAQSDREIKVNLLIDPEGYVFEKSGGKEARISDTIVSLYWKNIQTGEFELWPAEDYQQENPQTTDATGNYAFLAPAGGYYLQVEASGYPTYRGSPFELKTGAGVYQNIELEKKFGGRDLFAWEWLMFAGLVAVAVLLAVNFWRDRRRGAG